MLKQKYFLTNFFILSAEKQPIKSSWRNIEWLRFCGQQVPIVSFNNTAHAISESLGNKSVICREECDNCNE